MSLDLLSREMIRLMLSHLQVGEDAPTYIIRLKKPMEFYLPPRVIEIPSGGTFSIDVGASYQFGCGTATIVLEDTFGLKSPQFSTEEILVDTVPKPKQVIIGSNVDLASAMRVCGQYATYIDITHYTSDEVLALKIGPADIVVGGPGAVNGITDEQANGATRLAGIDSLATELIIQQYFYDHRDLFSSFKGDVKIKNRFFYELLLPETWIQICLGYGELAVPVITGAIDKVDINSAETKLTLEIRDTLRYLVDQNIDALRFGSQLAYPRVDKLVVIHDGTMITSQDKITYVKIKGVNSYLNIRTGPSTDFDSCGKAYNGQTFQYLSQAVSNYGHT
jgi:hypothetical protein